MGSTKIQMSQCDRTSAHRAHHDGITGCPGVKSDPAPSGVRIEGPPRSAVIATVPPCTWTEVAGSGMEVFHQSGEHQRVGVSRAPGFEGNLHLPGDVAWLVRPVRVN